MVEITTPGSPYARSNRKTRRAWLISATIRASPATPPGLSIPTRAKTPKASSPTLSMRQERAGSTLSLSAATEQSLPVLASSVMAKTLASLAIGSALTAADKALRLRRATPCCNLLAQDCSRLCSRQDILSITPLPARCWRNSASGRPAR